MEEKECQGKVVIAKKEGNLYYGYYKDGMPVELYRQPAAEANTKTEDLHILGNIYAARVERVADGIQGAFLEIQDGKCFFPLRNMEKPIKLSPGHEDRLYGGDIILVQITKDAVKTKLPVASADINLSGRYFVLTLLDKRYGVSKKIRDVEKRKNLEKLIKVYRSEDYGIIARTNAADEDEISLKQELEALIGQYKELMRKASFAQARTLLYKEPSHYITYAKDLPKQELKEIVIDDPLVYEECKAYYDFLPKEQMIPIRLYQDEYSLYNLYRMQHHYEDALSKYVWLKSGGSLVIEQTEAMVVIDVNTGSVLKGKKNAEEIFYQMNREAVYEIARQIRLRNLSGIIMIDFINMKKVEQQKKIMDLLNYECCKDRVRTRVVDMTALGLVEVTRSKELRPLSEQMKK